MILRLVKMKFKPEESANFIAFFDAIKDTIETMPGIISVKLYQDEKDQNVFFTHSIWLNTSSLDAYRTSDFFKDIWPKTKLMFEDKPMAWSLNLK
jgi:autoinducer 2-degrading protein